MPDTYRDGQNMSTPAVRSRSNPMQNLTEADIRNALGYAIRLSTEELRESVGASPSIKYFLIFDGNEFEAKVIIQLAWNLKYPDSQITATDFRGSATTVAEPLRNLGFDVIELGTSRRFGHVPGVLVGMVFESRSEASRVGAHRPTQAGICGAGDDGAESIVVSGGYIDDEDFGDRIIYTGHGGNDPQTRRQIADQLLERGNLALAVSCDQQLPVRVIRGSGGDPVFSPAFGYRYDGLFRVVRYWPEIGVDGFRIWRFELIKDSGESNVVGSSPMGVDNPERKPVTSGSQLVRDNRLSSWVKRIHDWTCQMCSDRIHTPAGAYAEAAHIRPLGTPHNGPDQTTNMLCLCPNCHKRLDTFARYVDEKGQVVETITGETLGPLRLHPSHNVLNEHLEYHREHALMIRES